MPGILTVVLIVLWTLGMISLPLINRIGGERATRWGVTGCVILQAVTVVSILAPVWGIGYTALVALSIAVMGWAVEFIGSRTGFPFGRYHYTDRLQPQLGHVPLLIPLAWLMMLPPAWAVGDLIAGGRGWAFMLVSGLALTAWDLFLDPQMVGWGFWVWEKKGGYYGIPWVNFLGWTLAAGLMTAIVRPRSLPSDLLLLIYGITWGLETVGLAVFWAQPGPALVGFACMGGLLAWACSTTR